MDTMNFLNKKYVSQASLSQSRSSRSFLPNQQYSSHHAHQSSTMPQPPHSPSTLNNHNSNSSSHLISNHCPVHQHELIRHLCLDCIELLCAECIGEHLFSHKESNSFPTIQTLKQVKTEMNLKLSEIMQFMFEEKNHPKYILKDIEKIRKESSDKIQSLRRDLVEYTDEWIGRLKGSILNNVGYEEIKVIKEEMYGLHEEVNGLNNCLSQNSVSVQAIKKAYQIDAERLQNSYKEMLEKYRNLSQTMRVDVEIDYDLFLKGLEQAIQIKVGSNIGKSQRQTVIRVDGEEEEQIETLTNLPLQMQENERKSEKGRMNEEKSLKSSRDDFSENIPYLFHLPSGSSVLSHFEPIGDSGNKINHFSLKGVSSYPLNSVELLPDSMIVASGGMISEEKKSSKVEIFDYTDGTLITESHLRQGRSSHQTVPFGERIFFIGGFTTEEGECRTIEYLSNEGMMISPEKCSWGGPNLSIIEGGKQIFKVTVSGVEVMDLSTLKWREVNTNVPFALSKGMKIENWGGNIFVFGDGTTFYRWDDVELKFESYESAVSLGNICCSTIRKGKIYGWMENEKTLAVFDGQKWAMYDNFSS